MMHKKKIYVQEGGENERNEIFFLLFTFYLHPTVVMLKHYEQCSDEDNVYAHTNMRGSSSWARWNSFPSLKISLALTLKKGFLEFQGHRHLIYHAEKW